MFGRTMVPFDENLPKMAMFPFWDCLNPWMPFTLGSRGMPITTEKDRVYVSICIKA